MRAMLLTAGEGTRMLPLTKDQPKCLLEIAGKPLIDYHLHALAQAGIHEVVINVARWAAMIQQALGQGERYGLKISYSVEQEPLETGGGILQALPLLGSAPFIVLNSDIWTDYPLIKLPHSINNLAHLVMVNNPPHHAEGDFYFHEGRLTEHSGVRLTYPGISVLHPQLFAGCHPGKFRLLPLFQQAIAANSVSAEYYSGCWIDVGTPQRLQEVRQLFINSYG